MERAFAGASTKVKNKEINIHRAAIFYTDVDNHSFKKKRAGEVVDTMVNGKFLVRCTGGVLIIHDYKSKCSIKKGMVLESGNPPLKKFQRNNHGFFDVSK